MPAGDPCWELLTVMPAGGSCKLCLIKLFGYKAIIFYISRDTTKLAFLTLAVLKVDIMNFGCFETGCFGSGCAGAGQIGFFRISLLAVLTLADLEGSRKKSSHFTGKLICERID
jgi:hypothetical protein